MIIKTIDKFKGNLMDKNEQRRLDIDRVLGEELHKKSIKKLFNTYELTEFVKIIEYELFLEKVNEWMCVELLNSIKNGIIKESEFINGYCTTGKDGFFKTLTMLELL